MNEKEERILMTMAMLIPKMSESEKMYLLGQAEGMALMKKKQSKEKENRKSENMEESRELQEV